MEFVHRHFSTIVVCALLSSLFIGLSIESVIPK